MFCELSLDVIAKSIDSLLCYDGHAETCRRDFRQLSSALTCCHLFFAWCANKPTRLHREGRTTITDTIPDIRLQSPGEKHIRTPELSALIEHR